ncbi:DUF5924 family protein [Arhodomonas sp. SL1]|uniref:DUF5924 family protein n=1 Tax=Arhodomonas sp. SL1 TaxID=3425691 RepID=UPI003F8858C7
MNNGLTSPDHQEPTTTRDAPRLRAVQDLVERWVARARPWSGLWPPTALLLGLASFFLVERQQWLGGALALGMLLSWLLLLFEGVIGRGLARRGYPAMPRAVTTFVTQMVHQETLFFALPFLLATTVWSSGQALFTLLIIAMALLSILDPVYYRLAERSRWLYFAFHAQCVFLVVLVALPVMLKLTTGESLLLALAAMIVFSLPSVLHLLRPVTGRHGLAVLTLLPALALAGWSGRVWVPPASLWISGSALSPEFDEQQRAPRGNMPLTAEALTGNGLYAYTSIHAPRGLREKVFHEWRHDGKLVDRIPLVIHGGRAEGYRAWTHKENFPEEPVGQWRIDVMTASDQRIGVLRFTVAETEADATVADGSITNPPGVPGLRLGQLLPEPAPARKADTDG